MPDSWAELLERAVPPVPERLRTPPRAAIRRRARRRGALAAAIVAGVGAAVLVTVSFIATSVRPTPIPSQPASQPASRPPAGAIPWILAKVEADGRTLRIGVFHPEPFPDCRDSSPVAKVVEEPSRVVVTVTASMSPRPCDGSETFTKVVPVSLRADLGDRRLVDGYDGRERPPVPARLFPAPSYPAGLVAGGDQPATAAGDRVGWALAYGGVGGPDVGLFVSTATPVPEPDGEQVGINGRDAWLSDIPETGRGHGYGVVWTVDGWWIELSVVWAPGQAGTRVELQRVLDGLRWS
jgi:hypothetical protein